MVRLLRHLKRPPWRTVVPLGATVLLMGLGYLVWSPGQRVRDGRHDLGTNAIWLQHGWLGDDVWFERNGRDKSRFRDDAKIRELAELLSAHGIRDVYPHLCPCTSVGDIAAVDPAQTERFLDHFEGFRVLPWIGGRLDVHCSPESPRWRARFVASAVDLLTAHPRLAGVHVNIEPMPSGNSHFMTLLQELRQALPAGKTLSVAAYPPPTLWHRFPEVHWDRTYYGQLAAHVDQMAVMMYDTAIRWQKPYRKLMADWTQEVLAWAPNAEILLGVPVYDDADSGYHFPKVENLDNALVGIHAGLARLSSLPANYRGIAIYCEWEMDRQEWRLLSREYGQARPTSQVGG